MLEMTVGFENAQAYPVTQDVNGMTIEPELHLTPTANSSVFAGQTTLSWSVEGTYHAIFSVVFENATGPITEYLGVTRSVAITVYPKAQFAQIESNHVSMTLTIAIYMLTLVGTFDLVLSLWDRKPPTQEQKNGSENTSSDTKEHNTKTNIGPNSAAENRTTSKANHHSTEPYATQRQDHQ